jgi:hypothetical protein
MTKNERYQIKRDALIPIAKRYADEIEGKQRKGNESYEKWAYHWNVVFLHKMDELARERGLIT